MKNGSSRIISITIQSEVLHHRSQDEEERKLTIADLLDENHFELVGRKAGPYRLTLSKQGPRLAFQVYDENELLIVAHLLSFSPLLRALREYNVICEAHSHAAIRSNPFQLETIDMGRRAVHNYGSQLLIDRLAAKIKLDLDTARRLFTLISVTWGPAPTSARDML